MTNAQERKWKVKITRRRGNAGAIERLKSATVGRLKLKGTLSVVAYAAAVTEEGPKDLKREVLAELCRNPKLTLTIELPPDDWVRLQMYAQYREISLEQAVAICVQERDEVLNPENAVNGSLGSVERTSLKGLR